MNHANLTLVRQRLCTWVSPDELVGGGEAFNTTQIMVTFHSSAPAGNTPRGDRGASPLSEGSRSTAPLVGGPSVLDAHFPSPCAVSHITRCFWGNAAFPEMLAVMFARPSVTRASGWGLVLLCSLFHTKHIITSHKSSSQ